MKPTIENLMEKNKRLFKNYVKQEATWKLVEGNHKGHYFVKFEVPGEDGGIYTYVVMDDGRIQYYFG